MTINIKYYVITIVAIFLALGIGLFIGIMLDGQDLIVEQQQQLVSQLESKFDEFRVKQVELQDKIDGFTIEREKNAKFIDIAYPEIVRDKLKGFNIVVVETREDYPYAGIIDELKKAGANSVASILVKNTFNLDNEAIAFEVAKDLQLEGSTKEEIEKQLMVKFTEAMLDGEKGKTLAYLKEKKMIDYNGDVITPKDHVVIAGGRVDEGKELLNKIDIPLINRMKNNNVPVMAVEKLGVLYSNVAEYKKLRVSTVDNVDTTIGKVSMLMVISGQEGHYGEKETAEKLIPEGFIRVD